MNYALHWSPPAPRSHTPVPVDLKAQWDSRWGGLLRAVPVPVPHSRGLRVAFFGGTPAGNAVLRYLATRPDLNLVGVATDELFDPTAQIGRDERVWSRLSSERCEALQQQTESLALSQGADAYTGEVDCQTFRRLFARWAPDLVLMVGCGQELPTWVLEQTKYGAYTFHPANLATFNDAVRAGVVDLPITCHTIEQGCARRPLVGESRGVSLVDGNGGRLRLVDTLEVLGVAISEMTRQLVDAVVERGTSVDTMRFG